MDNNPLMGTDQRVPFLTPLTKAYPNDKAEETKYYRCILPAASLHRPDGKKLGFVGGFFATDMVWDQKYLDGEIANGNPYIREATDEEIFAAKLKMNARGAVTEQVRKELEPLMRAELEAEIRKEMELKYANHIAPSGSPNSSDGEGREVDTAEVAAKQAEIDSLNKGGELIGGTATTATDLMNRLKRTVAIPGATITLDKPAGGDTAGTTEAKAPLGGIVSTKDIGGDTVISNVQK